MIRLGLCCINTQLRDIKPKRKQVFCSRSCTRATFTVEKAKQLATKNIQDIVPLVSWNSKNGISLMRLTSDFFPHYSDDETESYDLKFSLPVFEEVCEELLELAPHRFTSHPGQYCCLGTRSPGVLEKTKKDLEMHAFVLDCLSNASPECDVVNIHGGGVYGDKDAAIRRWVENFDDLPRTVKDKLTIENDEKSYSFDDCFNIAEQCNIPVVFDLFHHLCHNRSHGDPSYKYETDSSLDETIADAVETWGTRTPLFHLSEQKVGARLGSHSDLIETIPKQLLGYHQVDNIDIDIEAKLKEQAILKLYAKYPEVFSN